MLNRNFVRSAALLGALLTAQMGQAQDVQLLDPSLLSPRGGQEIATDTFKKEAPWTIGFSWPGVGNTWILDDSGN